MRIKHNNAEYDLDIGKAISAGAMKKYKDRTFKVGGIYQFPNGLTSFVILPVYNSYSDGDTQNRYMFFGSSDIYYQYADWYKTGGGTKEQIEKFFIKNDIELVAELPLLQNIINKQN